MLGYYGLQDKIQEMEDRKYEAGLRQEGYRNILKYGVAFCYKECMVKLEK